MPTYDFTHLDFSKSDISDSLGRAYQILLERAIRRVHLADNEVQHEHSGDIQRQSIDNNDRVSSVSQEE